MKTTLTTNANQLYDWSEAYDHSWLATDCNQHVALVVCIDPHVLPSAFQLDWRWLSGIEERLAEYYSGFPCRSISFTDLSDLLRRNGFFVINSYRSDKDAEIEYLDPLVTPVCVDDIPESFKTIASFFMLPEVSFQKHQTMISAAWKAGIGSLPDIELLHMGLSMALNPVSRSPCGFADHPITPPHGTFLGYKFLAFRFLPDSNLDSEGFLPTPHIVSWARYHLCFRKLADDLISISASSDLDILLQDQSHANHLSQKLEVEPPLAIRYYRGEALAAELLLMDTFVNGCRYEYALFASDIIRKQFADSIYIICGTMGIELTVVEDKPKPKGISHALNLVKRFLVTK